MPAASPKLILGSSSRYRKELLQRVIPDFSTLSPDVDESPAPGEAPGELALRLARMKADTVAANEPGAVVIGSDQVAALGNRIFGKPGNQATALEQLSRCSGHAVAFYTAVCVISPTGNPLQTHTDITSVQFRNLSSREITRYLELEQPWDCAGSFRSEGLGVALFESIKSEDPTALIGLPMIWLAGALRRAGLDPLNR